MRHSIFILVIIISMETAAAAEETRKQIAYVGGAPHERVLPAVKWFATLDSIEDSARSGTQQGDRQVLEHKAKRYARIAAEISEMQKVKDLEPLQEAYAEYYRGAAEVCRDKIKAKDDAERKLIGQKEAALDAFFQNCRLVDNLVRVRFRYRTKPMNTRREAH